MNSDPLFQLLNHPIISQRYFFPRSGRPANPVDFAGYDGTTLCCSRSPLVDGQKTLVHFHGNGEIVADYDDGYLENLASLGVNVIMMEYRGYGRSSGKPELGKMLADVGALIQGCGLLPQETVVYGRSVGAIFAVEWARRVPNIAGLILESGVADPYQRLAIRLQPEELGTDEDTLREACFKYLDHRSKLRGFKGDMLVLHAAQDDLVEPSHAEAHIDYCPHSHKKLVLFPRGNHNTIIGANWTHYLLEIKMFLDSLER